MLQFTIKRDRDPDSASLRRLLEAHVIYERMAAAKKLCLDLLAFVGVVVWLGAIWPTLLPLHVLDSVLAVWISLLFFAILATVEEWLWRRKVARYRDEREAKPEQTTRGAG